MLKNDSHRMRYLMTKTSFRYIAIAVAAVALLGMSLVHFDSFAAAQSNKKIRAVLPGKSTKSDMPSARERAESSEEELKLDSRVSQSATDKSLVSSVRFISTSRYTRVLLDLSKEAKYEINRLEGDKSKGLAPRTYIDISGARLLTNSKEPLAVGDRLLRQIRVGQYSDDVVRVVLDLADDSAAYAISLLPDLYRLVIHIQAEPTGETVKSGAPAKPVIRATAKTKQPAPAKGTPSGIRKIVLDPGHGGKDPGAIGAGGVAEKDLVLSIAKKLAVKLTRELGIEVILTRKDDRYVPLEDRTATANAEDADLFVSLHMNASPNLEARGLETYYLDNTSDEASIRLAARENSTSRKNISDLQFILSDMMQNVKLEDSISLAHHLQGAVVSGMSRKMSDVKDLGVKKALFYVLVGARMPSVLVEMFFITNRVEGRVMNDEGHQDAMVDALLEGIRKYNQGTVATKTL
jgi:N-acetylmuramoyl-L-alanine amidase